MKYMFMPKQSQAVLNLTPANLSAIETMGAHLAVARVRRKERQKTAGTPKIFR